MGRSYVSLNGKLVPLAEARISPMDRGFLFGDGVFETVGIYNGHGFQMRLHLDRLGRSLAALRIKLSIGRKRLERECEELIAENEIEDGALRITVTRGSMEGPFALLPSKSPTRLIHTRNAPGRERMKKGVAAVVSRKFRMCPSPLRGLKTLNYLPNLIAKQEALDAGCVEALIKDEAGCLVEGASSNLFFVIGGNILTPPADSLMLAGITRANCIGILESENIGCLERPVMESDLAQCSELLIVNSVMDIVPVVKVDGAAIGSGQPGPVFRELAKKYRELVEDDSSRHLIPF